MKFLALKYVIPVIASLIFVQQLYREKTTDLSTWKGGGMGMFAAWDRPSRARYTHIFIEVDGERLPLMSVTPLIDRMAYKIKTEPTDKHFNALGTKLTNMQWHYSGEQLPIMEQDGSGKRKEISTVPEVVMYGKQPVKADAIILEYGKVHYDIKKQEVSQVSVEERRYEF